MVGTTVLTALLVSVSAITLVTSEAEAGELTLEAGFHAPPQQAKPLVWWDWVNGSVTKEGIKADLEDMKRAGIGGVQLFDLELYMPKGPVRYGSKNWHDHVKYAMETAKKLGLEFHVMNCPGWSASGGPWITQAKSMKKLAWSHVGNVTGPTQLTKKLGAVKGSLGDVAVMAIPKESGKSYRLPHAKDKIMADKPEPGAKRTTPSLDDPDLRAIPLEKVLNLTRHLTKNGVLKCKIREGEWTLIRFGFASTGKGNHPAVPEGKGLEVDKLDPKAVAFQFNKALGRIIQNAKPYLGKTFKGILFDSFEGGFQNWTETLPDQFKDIHGYDLVPYLPVLAGYVVGSGTQSEAVLYDFRQAIDQMLAKNYFGVMQRLAHENKLITFSESQGGPLNPFHINEYVDVPMNEFWHRNYVARTRHMKITTSSAYLYGRRIIGAEAFTATPDYGKWQNTPRSLKKPGDVAFTAGINRFIFHTYIHQPYSHLKPGFTMGRYGTHFGRQNSWWKFVPAWISYLSRSQFLLQQGETVTDIGFLYPNDIRYLNASTPSVPEGFDYLILYPRHLEDMQFEGGRFVTKSGHAFRVLMLPNDPFLSVDALKNLQRLVQGGAPVFGNPPLAPPGLVDTLERKTEFKSLVFQLWQGGGGEAKVVRPIDSKGYAGYLPRQETTAKALQQLDLDPDLSFSPKPELGQLRFIHRKTDAEDIYFVCSLSDASVATSASFRVTGKTPEFWDAITGKRWDALSFVVNDRTTTVPIQLDSRGSIFVIFRKPLPKRWVTSVQGNSLVRFGERLLVNKAGKVRVHYSDKTKSAIVVDQPSKAISIDGPWQVKFLDGRGAPPEVKLDSLVSWTKHPHKDIRYYSGVAEYRINVELSKNVIKEDERSILTLGRVCDIAQVSINGSSPTILWKEPFQIDVTEHLKAGNNELVILVANRWINRLIGDEQFPVDYTYQKGGSKFTAGRVLKFPKWLNDPEEAKKRKRYTFATWKHYSSKSPLVPSGLLGPVKLERYKDVTFQ